MQLLQSRKDMQYRHLHFWYDLRFYRCRTTPAMDRVIPQNEQRAAKRNKTFRWMLIALVIAIIGYFGIQALRPSAASSDFRMATVDRGSVKSSINAAGLVVPAFEEQLNAPVSTEIQKVLLRSGAEVKLGDLIMELDQEYVALQLEGQPHQLTLKQNNVDLPKLEYDRDLRGPIDLRLSPKPVAFPKQKLSLLPIKRTMVFSQI